MENTRLNKKIYLAQHWGQYGFRKHHVDREEGHSVPINEYHINEIEHAELKSLTNLSEEDAKTLIIYKCVIDGYKEEALGFESLGIQYDETKEKLYIECEMTHTNFSNWMERLFIHNDNFKTYQSDFLRRKGYAVEFHGLTVKELIRRGWLKLKEGN